MSNDRMELRGVAEIFQGGGGKEGSGDKPSK